jgi:hypothetical protein
MSFENVAVVALEGTQRCNVADDDEIVSVKKEAGQSSKTPGHKPVVVADGPPERLVWCSGCSGDVDMRFAIIDVVEFLCMGKPGSGASLLVG